MQQQQTLEQAHLNTARLQEQNDILHKQTVKLQEHTDTLSREVERLSHLERTLHSLQRDHDALHKVHADSQKQLETLKHHAHAAAQFGQVGVFAVHRNALYINLAFLKRL